MESDAVDADIFALATLIAHDSARIFNNSSLPVAECISSAALALVWLVRTSSVDDAHARDVFEKISLYFANRAGSAGETLRKEALH